MPLPEDSPLKPGTRWVRNEDGQETVIISVTERGTNRAHVVHQSKRRTYTLLTNFVRKYTPAEGSGDD